MICREDFIVMNEQHFVSIGLPTYNRADILPRAIDSVLAQDYSYFELILSDNASSDTTEAVCLAYTKLDARIRYHRNDKNLGAIENYNTVLMLSRGEYYIAFADDDILAPNYVSSCLNEILSRPGSALISGRCLLPDGMGKWNKGHSMNILPDSPQERVLQSYSAPAHWAFHGIARRDLFESIAPMPRMIGGDWLYMARIAFFGTIHTIDTTAIWKSTDGASSNLVNLAAAEMLPPSAADHSHRSLLLAAVRDIALASPVYAVSGRADRLRLAARVALVLILRFTLEYLDTYILQYLRPLTPRVLTRSVKFYLGRNKA